MNIKAVFDSLVRTFVPIIVGAVLGWFTTKGITLDPEFETALTLLVGSAFSGVYYIAARLLEVYVTPKFGWLLGLAKQPDYFKRVKVTDGDETFTVRVDSPVAVDDVIDVASQDRYPLNGK